MELEEPSPSRLGAAVLCTGSAGVTHRVQERGFACRLEMLNGSGSPRCSTS